MNIYKIMSVLFILSFATDTRAQEIQWRGIDDDTRHLVGIHFGADYSSYYGVSYGYRIKNSILPLMVGTELDLSFGSKVWDDWKSKTSIQAEIWQAGDFNLSVKSGIIIRQYVSDISKLNNIGLESALLMGYTRARWGISLNASYDLAAFTHIRHDRLKEYYPAIRDGWYDASGGNFKLGTRVYLSFQSWNIYLNLGKTFGQNFKDNPTLPFYANIVLQKQF